MLFTLGSILAGVLLYDHLTSERTKEGDVPTKGKRGEDATSVIYHVRGGEGEISLPPCRLMVVELGPSADPNKATLQIVVNKSVETECKPVTDIGKEKKYVKLTPTQYQTNI